MRLYLGKMGGVYNLLAGATGLVLLLILGLMLFPATPQLAQAEEGNSKASLTINPVIGLSMQDTITVDVTPTQDGAFSSSTASLSVSTNNETGYSLYLSTANGENTLTSQNPAISNIVSAVDGGDSGVTPANFANNTWGYNLSQETASDTTTYKAVPTTANDAIITTESPTDADTYNLTIGTKISTSLPSGTYSNQVVVSAVANPAYIPSLSQITFMQEMTPEICAKSTENETTRLTDMRDNKQYWVTKLADGNCWMTQNLDLDLNASTLPLTPATSDVSSSWSPDVHTESQGTITNSSSYAGTYSWDVGMYINNNPASYTECPETTNINTCSNWTNVASMSPMTEENTTGNVISNNTYDAHYLAGNYYQWNAATAGTGGTITSQDATDSICPKGWHLPTSNNSNSGSFQALVGNLDSTQIVQSPYYFNPSGFVLRSLMYAGDFGAYWSSTAVYDTQYAYYLNFYPGYVGPSYYSPSLGNARYYGHSVRCLAD